MPASLELLSFKAFCGYLFEVSQVFLATVMNYKLSIQLSCAEIFYLNLNPAKSKFLVLRFDKQEINPEVTN